MRRIGRRRAGSGGAAAAPPAHEQQEGAKDDHGGDGVVHVVEAVLPLLPVVAHLAPDQGEHEDPRDAAERRQEREAPEGHPRDAGRQRDERPDDREHAGEEHGPAAVPLEPVVRPAQVRRLDVELLAVLLEPLDAAVVADPVRDPRAHDVGGRACRDDGQHRVLTARDVEAREQEGALRRDRDARALEHHQDEDPGQPERVDDVDRELDERVGEGGDHQHGDASG